MNDIDLFDNFINGNLSEDERKAFEAKLDADKDFASDFKMYCLTLKGLSKESRQDNKDFEEAMKRISKKELQNIIGMRPAGPTKPVKEPYFKKWILWQGIGIAALLGIGIIYVVIARNEANSFKKSAALARIEADSANSKAQDKVENAIYFAYINNDNYSRAGAYSRGSSQDIADLTDEQLRERLPYLESYFHDETDEYDIAELGSDLVLAYVRLHQTEKAISLLSELIDEFKNNPDFETDVNNWQTILNLIQ